MPVPELMAALLVGTSTTPSLDDIVIRGNVALPEAVYRTVLRSRLPAGGSPDEVDEVLTAFLVESGYELATVEVTEGDILIEEGRLDSVIFIGAGGGTVLGFKLSFNLPGQVFNRSLIEQELDRLVKESGLADATWELVPTRNPINRSPLQLQEARLGTVTVLQPGEEYELRVFVRQHPYAPGFDLGLGFRPPLGVFVNGTWRFGQVFLPRDRLTFFSSLGVDVGDLADEPADRLGITQAVAKLTWYTPPLGVKWLRSFLDVDAQAQGRNRTEDIGIRSFLFAPIAASANLQFQFDDLATYVGGGLEQRFILRVEAADDPDAADLALDDEAIEDVLEPPANLRPFFAFGTSLNLSPSRLRKDQLHQFRVDGKVLGVGPDDTRGIIDVRGRYENTIRLGWDEFRYAVVGAFLGGDVPYFNEVAFGEGFLTAAFLDEIYTTRILTGKLQYRLSLSRDVFKISLFNDVAVYEALEAFTDPDFVGFPTRVRQGARFVESVGLGLHALVLDVFQVDLYAGFGINTDGDADVDISLSVKQVF
jgi:hypothetical protein